MCLTNPYLAIALNMGSTEITLSGNHNITFKANDERSQNSHTSFVATCNMYIKIHNYTQNQLHYCNSLFCKGVNGDYD